MNRPSPFHRSPGSQRPDRRLGRAGALLAVAALSATLLAGCGDDDATADDDTTGATSSAAAESSEPTASATAGESASPKSGEAPDAAGSFVTPFYVGDTPQGPRLFRELHADAAPETALDLLMAAPQDPDYSSLVPADSLEPGTGVDGTGADGAFSVELADASWTKRPAQMSAAEAALAVQQIVWTLQTLQDGETYDPTVRAAKTPVNFYLDGKEVSYLGVPSGAKALPELKVLALVNVISGLDDASLAKQGTAVGGVASSFEATVPWEVRDADGEVVQESFATAEGWMGGLFPFTANLKLADLPAGTYTFVARTDDPSGGAEGNGPTEDTKVFTIE